MWQGARFVGSVRYDADAAFLMMAANELGRGRTAQIAAEAENERLRSLLADIPTWLAAEVHHAIDNEHQLVGGGIFRAIPEGGEIVPGVRASNIDAVLDRAHRDPRMAASPDLVSRFSGNWFGPSPDGHVDAIQWADPDHPTNQPRPAGPPPAWTDLPLTPCPTCQGPSRETVDMVCQTCGRDYAAPGSELRGPDLSAERRSEVPNA